MHLSASTAYIDKGDRIVGHRIENALVIHGTRPNALTIVLPRDDTAAITFLDAAIDAADRLRRDCYRRLAGEPTIGPERAEPQHSDAGDHFAYADKPDLAAVDAATDAADLDDH